MPAKSGFQLQESDITILHIVHELRLATIEHISVLSGRSVRALWGRLRKLAERRYLTSVSRFMQKHVYAIGGEGVPVLIEHGYAPRDLAAKRLRSTELKEIGIRHALFVSDIHARIIQLTRPGAVTLTSWREGPSLWDSVRPREGEPAIPVRPDAYFALHTADHPPAAESVHVFLEADRSTMAHSRMAEKLAGYRAYHHQGRHTKKYPEMTTFIVATITETRSRADALRNDLHPMIPRPSWRAAYRFIAFEDLSLGSLFTYRAAA